MVVKLPRFPFDKFPGADRSLGSQMKATGEVMAIDRTFGAALNKALRGLEQAGAGFLAEDPSWDDDLAALSGAVAGRPHRRPVAAAQGVPGAVRLAAVAPAGAAAAGRPGRRAAPGHGIAPWFLAEMERLVDLAHRMTEEGSGAHRRPARGRQARLVRRPRHRDPDRPRPAARSPSDAWPSACGPGFAMVDTCAAEFAAETPYFYATYAATGSPPEAPPVARPAALVIGSGPVRIGQGIEFDYCAVQAADALARGRLARR